MKSIVRQCAWLLVSVLLSGSATAQSLYEVSDVEKTSMSTFIFEGHVVGQQSFKTDRGMIFTDNAVRVYKLFRGNVFTDTLHVLTQGGQVGNEIVVAEDLLQLNKGDYGLFFAHPNVVGIKAPGSQQALLDVYSSAQGFYRMDWLQGQTSTPFKQFSLRNNQFYDYLRSNLKLPTAAELHPLDEYLHPEKYRVGVADSLATKAVDNQATLATEPLPVAGGQADNKAQRLQRTQVLAITSFSPAVVNAGATADVANNLLTINGTDFGAPGGTAAILFDDANDGTGGTDWTVLSTDNLVVSWTNTQIQVRVPSRAGTGALKVRNAAGSVAQASSTLRVFYSILAPTSNQGVTRQANLSNINGLGGYSLFYNPNVPANIVATHQRALNTWKEMAGFNILEAGTANVDSVSNVDGFNMVMLDNAGTKNPPLAAGVLAVCYSGFVICNNIFVKNGFDIVIRNSGFSAGATSFEVGPCPPPGSSVDLETVLFHELGHAGNLGHINDGAQIAGLGQSNPSKVMHFAVNSGLKRTSPDASALQGMLSQTFNTTQTGNLNCNGIFGYMTPLQRIVEAKDECPLGFPTAPTSPGTTVDFDLAHSSSNTAVDPQFNNFTCVANNGNSITNTAFYALRTNAGGILDIGVTDWVNTTAGQTGCTSTPAVEVALYQVNTCPAGQNYPAPVACRAITGNGPLVSISGLLPNTSYLLVADGSLNTKATFKLTFTGTALPLKLRHFVGQLNGPVNTLQWSIESFTEVAKVVLERSTENNQYVGLTTFDNSQLATNRVYVYDDANPVQGMNYYRLAIFNKDGSVEYSQVVLLNRADAVRIAIRPNPVQAQAQLNLFSANNLGNVSLQIMNVDGKRIYQQKVTLLQGQSNFPIALQMPAGTYFVTVVNSKGQMIASQTLIKK